MDCRVVDAPRNNPQSMEFVIAVILGFLELSWFGGPRGLIKAINDQPKVSHCEALKATKQATLQKLETFEALS